MPAANSVTPVGSAKLKETSSTNFRVIAALVLLHFAGDLYMAFINPLLPALASKHALTLVQVGLIGGMSRILSFFVQPLVGYAADRYRNRLFIVGGPLLTAIFIPLVGVVPHYWMLLVCVGLGSIGSAMFHPPAAGMIPQHAGKRHGLAMAIFVQGGTLAFGIGPLIATWWVAGWGLESLSWSSAVGLSLVAGMMWLVPRPQGEGLQQKGFLGAMREVFAGVWRRVALYSGMIILVVFYRQSFATFMPMLFASQGFSLTYIGLVISLYTVFGAISGLLAGHLSDRMGHRPIYFTALLCTAPCLLGFLYLPGKWNLLAAAAAGFFGMAILPMSVALAQKAAPKGASLVTSLTLGVAFGIGGMITPITGKLCDTFGIVPVLTVVAVSPLAAACLATLLPKEG